MNHTEVIVWDEMGEGSFYSGGQGVGVRLVPSRCEGGNGDEGLSNPHIGDEVGEGLNGSEGPSTHQECYHVINEELDAFQTGAYHEASRHRLDSGAVGGYEKPTLGQSCMLGACSVRKRLTFSYDVTSRQKGPEGAMSSIDRRGCWCVRVHQYIG